MSCDGTRAEDLATEFGISGKELRDWLREAYPRAAEVLGLSNHAPLVLDFEIPSIAMTNLSDDAAPEP
jgi:hypothetical protein